jgi:hypothetical protein
MELGIQEQAGVTYVHAWRPPLSTWLCSTAWSVSPITSQTLHAEAATKAEEDARSAIARRQTSGLVYACRRGSILVTTIRAAKGRAYDVVVVGDRTRGRRLMRAILRRRGIVVVFAYRGRA